jgi:hypothetical protein
MGLIIRIVVLKMLYLLGYTEPVLIVCVFVDAHRAVVVLKTVQGDLERYIFFLIIVQVIKVVDILHLGDRLDKICHVDKLRYFWNVHKIVLVKRPLLFNTFANGPRAICFVHTRNKFNTQILAVRRILISRKCHIHYILFAQTKKTRHKYLFVWVVWIYFNGVRCAGL